MSLDLARRRFLYGSLTGLGGIALSDVMRGATVTVQSARAEDARTTSPRRNRAFF